MYSRAHKTLHSGMAAWTGNVYRCAEGFQNEDGQCVMGYDCCNISSYLTEKTVPEVLGDNCSVR
jgi:hypothetical protein